MRAAKEHADRLAPSLSLLSPKENHFHPKSGVQGAVATVCSNAVAESCGLDAGAVDLNGVLARVPCIVQAPILRHKIRSAQGEMLRQ
eukprot:5785533-Amphidinium_carterae.1